MASNPYIVTAPKVPDTGKGLKKVVPPPPVFPKSIHGATPGKNPSGSGKPNK